jgi:hypothetical protein
MKAAITFNVDGTALSRTVYESPPPGLVSHDLVWVTSDTELATVDLARLSATIDSGSVVSVEVAAAPLLVTLGLKLNGAPVAGGEVTVEQNAAVTLKLVVTVSNGFTGAHGLPVMIRGTKDVKRLTFAGGVCEVPIATSLAIGEYEMNAADVLRYLSVQHPSTSLVVTGKAWVSIWPET